jgi:hypothetical protein
MKHGFALIAPLVTAITALAAPISFSENFDSYAAGSNNRSLSPYSDAANWPTTSGYTDRQVIQSSATSGSLPSTLPSSPNILQLDNGSSYGAGFGITHDFGGEYKATAANPIVAQWQQYFVSTSTRKQLDFYVDLAKDDVSGGTLSSPESHNAVGVAQSVTVRGGQTNSKGQWYDGNAWHETGAPTAGGWKTVTLTVTDTTFAVTWGDGGTYSGARGYLGTFDQINIRHPQAGTGGAAYLDNLSVTGGELVAAPEPATIAWLGLGTLGLMKARSRRK